MKTGSKLIAVMVASVGLLALADFGSGVFAVITSYMSPTAYNAAATGSPTLIDFGGIAPAGGAVSYFTPSGVTLSGVQFVGVDASGSYGKQLYIESASIPNPGRNWGTGDNLVGDRFGAAQVSGIPHGYIEANLPAGTYSVGTDFMLVHANGSRPSEQVLFDVWTGLTDTQFTLSSVANGVAFAGFVSDTPITKIQYRTLGVGGDNSPYGALDNFAWDQPRSSLNRLRYSSSVLVD